MIRNWPQSVHVGSVVYPPSGTHGPRIQGHYQLVALHSGSLRLTIDDVVHQFGPGTLVWLQPGWREFFEFAKDDVTYHSWIDYFGEPGADWSHRLLDLPLSLPIDDEIERLLQDALHMRVDQSGYAREYVWTLAYQVLLLSLDKAKKVAWAKGKVTKPHRHHEAIQQVIYYVGARLGEDLTLSDLAQVASVSTEHLCRLFKRAGYPSPMEWLWHTRTEHGLMMLRSTGLSIFEVARQCGFKSQFHFSRRVKQATGMTPTDYRVQSTGARPTEPSGESF